MGQIYVFWLFPDRDIKFFYKISLRHGAMLTYASLCFNAIDHRKHDVDFRILAEYNLIVLVDDVTFIVLILHVLHN
jgi:hypothetical protein